MEFEYIERRGTGSAKWDSPAAKQPNTIPMGLADTDFLCPPEVTQAVMNRAKDGLYGYSSWQHEGYQNAAKGWFKRRYHWEIETGWMVFIPGVVPALSAAVQALTEPGDGVIIQPPVYHPFRHSVENNGRTLRLNPLRAVGDTYEMDFEGLEALAAEPATKMMIMCNPHNPVGRVWGREEVERVCKICAAHDVILVADAIHADLVMKGVTFYAAGPIALQCGCKCISCYAPSKTFNMAGIQSSTIVIPDEELRTRFSTQLRRCGMPNMNVFAAVATEAAWNHGDRYVDEVMAYIEANVDHAIDFFAKYTPKITMRKPEGTYLGWVNLKGLGVSHEEACRFFTERAGILINEGTMFGQEGSCFVRVNFACHRSTLDKALEQLKAAYETEFA